MWGGVTLLHELHGLHGNLDSSESNGAKRTGGGDKRHNSHAINNNNATIASLRSEATPKPRQGNTAEPAQLLETPRLYGKWGLTRREKRAIMFIHLETRAQGAISYW